MSEQAYPDTATRRLITTGVTIATLMTALDMTIANVALPHMQGSVSASADEITWVLTSYIVSSAIFIPLSGWLASRYGRKRVMTFSVAGFTIASILCGMATNLGELVGFRMLQGALGAALVPMSQVILLNINPPERQASAMALWGMGAVLGPILGPVIGGWLTDSFSWRWVFFINVPLGILSFVTIATFFHEEPVKTWPKFDFTGFALGALAIAMFQLMLDRGQQQDWFASPEICIEAAASAFFFYAFIVHIMLSKTPFLSTAMFRDRNFTIGVFCSFLFGTVLFSVMALLPSMLQRLLGYPVVYTGIVMIPRGLGSFLSMWFVSIAVKYVSPRILMFIGLLMMAFALYLMSDFNLAMDSTLVLISGLFAGFGTGLMFVPLSAMTFGTLDPKFRNEGASMYTLIRNIGSAVGISLLQVNLVRQDATVHSRLVEAIRPDNPMLDLRAPGFDFHAPEMVARMNGMISQQASMVSYVDVFWGLLLLTMAMAPFIWMMRTPKRAAKDDEQMAVHLE